MELHYLQELDLEYNLIWANRVKTMGLKIDPVEGIIVRAPKSISIDKVEELLLQKQDWIFTKLDEIQAVEIPRPKEFVSGERFTYLGRNYKLRIYNSEDAEPSIKLYRGIFEFRIPDKLDNEGQRDHIIKELFRDWYYEKAINRFHDRLEKYEDKVEIQPSGLEIKEYKSRWGQTTQDDKIILNWKLIMAPTSIIDYVICHELCHLVVEDHSKGFWSLLSSIIFDYKEREEWLKIHGLTLTLE